MRVSLRGISNPSYGRRPNEWLSPSGICNGNSASLAARLQEFAERALAKIPKNHSLGQIDVLLISDRRMAALHWRFMKIAGPTDVITFQHGEIFISVETAKRNARSFRTSTEEEVKLYIVHGLLHLHGFDDKTAAQARRMEKEQIRIMKAASRTV